MSLALKILENFVVESVERDVARLKPGEEAASGFAEDYSPEEQKAHQDFLSRAVTEHEPGIEEGKSFSLGIHHRRIPKYPEIVKSTYRFITGMEPTRAGIHYLLYKYHGLRPSESHEKNFLEYNPFDVDKAMKEEK